MPSPLWSHRGPAVLVGLALGMVLGLPGAVRAQAPADQLQPGPTREALMATAVRMSSTEARVPQILPRYHDFERDFRTDFGPGQLSQDPDDFMNGIHQRLTTRFGDTPVYQWVQRGLVLYARVKAFTEMERNGFNMAVEMDDVAEGKLGVRVNRAFE